MLSAEKPRVLLIESESELRDLNKLILQEANYQVQILPPNADPVAFAARTHPNAIVVQVRPGEPQDWQIIDGLNANQTTEAIPIVVISATERYVAMALAAPVVVEAIVMPYDIDALQQSVATALRHPPPAAVLPPAHRPPPELLVVASALLNAHSRVLVLRVIRRLQDIEPFKSRFAQLSPEVVNDMPRILGAIVVGLQRDLTPRQVFATKAIRADLKEHVNLRMSQGLDPSAVIQEYQVLDDEILAFMGEHSSDAHFDANQAFDIARTMDDFIAETLRIAMNEFLGRVEQRTPRGHVA